MMAELSLVAKATILLTLALAMTRGLRGARASVRALVLASTFGVLLILPPAALLLPERVIQVPPAYEDEVALVLEQLEIAAPASPAAPSDASASPHAWHLPAPAVVLRIVWTLVTIGMLLRLGLALWRLGTIRRTGVPWPGAAELVKAYARENGLRRRVDVFLHEDLAAPMTFGVRHPAIGLPMDAPRWNRAAVSHAVAHELEHVRRADWLVLLVTQVVCALYWFHPLVWVASRRLCLEAERACDDAVLRDAERATYAEQLVSLARRVSAGSPTAVLSMAARSDLSARVRAVLDPQQARGRAGGVWTSATVAGAAALTLAISPLSAVNRSAPVQTSPDTSERGQVELLIIEHAERPTPNDAPELKNTSGPPLDSPGTGNVGAEVGRRARADNGRRAIQASVTAPDFEVASVKPNTTGGGSMSMGWQPGGGFTAVNAPLLLLIQSAYGFRDSQLVDVPEWASSARFDVTAKAGADINPEQRTLMLQALLGERFKLAVHREFREMPIYALVAARDDRRVGPNLRRSEIDCSPEARSTRPGTAGAGTSPSTGGINRPTCGSFTVGSSLVAGGITLAQLASALTRRVDRIVVDRTGLDGLFDVDLTWTALTPASDAGPSIFTAVQEQLGLRLERARGPVEVLVIDRVQRPTEN